MVLFVIVVVAPYLCVRGKGGGCLGVDLEPARWGGSGFHGGPSSRRHSEKAWEDERRATLVNADGRLVGSRRGSSGALRASGRSAGRRLPLANLKKKKQSKQSDCASSHAALLSLNKSAGNTPRTCRCTVAKYANTCEIGSQQSFVYRRLSFTRLLKEKVYQSR